jgi:hypothetical protein
MKIAAKSGLPCQPNKYYLWQRERRPLFSPLALPNNAAATATVSPAESQKEGQTFRIKN